MRSLLALTLGTLLVTACDSTPTSITNATGLSPVSAAASSLPSTSTVRWNRKAIALFRARGGNAGRVDAYVSLAQYRAALAANDAKQGRSQPSLAAAVAAASVVVLKQFYPLDAASIDAELAEQRAEAPSGSEHNKDFAAGEAIGRQIGSEILTFAAAD